MIISAGKGSLIDRMLGAALLEQETYQEAALSPSVKAQALLVVILSSIAAGVGMLNSGLAGLLLGTFFAFVGWGLFVYTAYWTATTRYGVPRTQDVWGSTWRVLGLAATPRLFLIFTIVPGIGFLVGLTVHAWLFVTAGFALKPALDLDNRRTVLVALSGWLPMLILWAIVYLLA